MMNYDGQSVIKLYEFCKHNSAETISILNKELEILCQQDHSELVEISVHEFIRFQIEVEKILFETKFSGRTSASLFSVYKKRSKMRLCSLF